MCLAPLGAGDLIDRTVRLYRRHFATLVRVSAAPVIVSTIGAVLWAVGARGLGVTDSTALFTAYVGLLATGFVLQVCGAALYVVVMGGAARTLVAHLLMGEAVTARAVYGSVRGRFWRLLGATAVLGVWLLFAACAAAVVWLMVFAAGVFVIGMFVTNMGLPEWIASVVVLLLTLLSVAAAVWVFFYLSGLLAYVLQAVTVERRSVFRAVDRSVALARGHTRRLAAVVFFTTFASYSAWLLLVTPLLYVGIAEGYNLNPWWGEEAPAWYAIGFRVLWQASSILLAPVWVLGLSLLYIDERVRQEGYDIELAATRVFGDLPVLPVGYVAPLVPALASADTPNR